MSFVIEIAVTSRISAFPILYAKSRGFFEKEGIQVQIRVLENYDAILAFLSSGKIEAGEIPFTTWLDLHLEKNHTEQIHLSRDDSLENDSFILFQIQFKYGFHLRRNFISNTRITEYFVG
ncbi:NMT1/THI5 domain protein [Leptospira interrogans serovar Lora str. TE 1992]|uniref:NMT1/THI5 domain protein n=1 Tax=Leptospira interrogans serovar Lora str. TE 1992 TaxID=1193028 RepID=M3E167_LEPIR|nr:NMT1/THI5 domain protein [Leptospira interrogans serovar Lora str. TE 1992]